MITAVLILAALTALVATDGLGAAD